MTKTFSEEVAVGGVLKSSKLLAAFFETERPKLTKPVRWVRDRSLPDGIPARTTRQAEEDIIFLRVVPAEVLTRWLTNSPTSSWMQRGSLRPDAGPLGPGVTHDGLARLSIAAESTFLVPRWSPLAPWPGAA